MRAADLRDFVALRPAAQAWPPVLSVAKELGSRSRRREEILQRDFFPILRHSPFVSDHRHRNVIMGRLRPGLIVVLLCLIPLVPVLAQPADRHGAVHEGPLAEVTEELEALEVASHQWWLESDLEALDALMMGEFYFVAMNGAVETKAEVVGTGHDGAARAPRPLQIAELRVEPETVVVRGGEAVVISTLHLRATVQGRPIPERHRIMSVFLRDGEAWRLFARSITPILPPPPPRGAE